MLTDSNRSRSTRSLTAMTVALALAATATLAGAAGALAGKPAAEVTFPSTNGCIHSTAVSATFETTAKGHWFYYEYQATTTNSLGTAFVWPPDSEIVRGDAKAESIELLGHHSFEGPVGTIFEVRPTDRKGAALGDGAWQSSPKTYSCPQ